MHHHSAIRHHAVLLLILPFLLSGTGLARAYDINDQLAIGATLGIAGQCLEGAGDAADSLCRGAVPFTPELTFKPTDRDELRVKFGFAAGNGLNPRSPFVLAPWSANLEDDVKNINGRDRDYLLEASYAHTVPLGENRALQIVGGIIDSSAWINGNAYANDEYTQFMNEAFVNSPSALLASYDTGGALIGSWDDWTLGAVGMAVGPNDDGNTYNFYAGEVARRLETALGEGHYRIAYSSTSRAFLDAGGAHLERLAGWTLSFDQALGSVVGAFLRLGWQRDDALVDFSADYSGGLDIKGAAWGRPADNIGIAAGYLEGADPKTAGRLARTRVFETYYRFVVNDTLAISADVQYMADAWRAGDDVDGWILGMRAVAAF